MDGRAGWEVEAVEFDVDRSHLQLSSRTSIQHSATCCSAYSLVDLQAYAFYVSASAHSTLIACTPFYMVRICRKTL